MWNRPASREGSYFQSVPNSNEDDKSGTEIMLEEAYLCKALQALSTFCDISIRFS